MDRKAALLDELRIDRSGSAETPSRFAAGRWIGIGIFVLLLVIAVLLYTGLHKTSSASTGAARSEAVASSAAQTSTPSQPAAAAGSSLLDATGYVVAFRQATVSGKSIYKVNEVLVEEGQAVKKGEIMARLDDTNVHAALDQSKAQVRQLEAVVAAARKAAQDAQPIFARNERQLHDALISQDTFDTARATYDALTSAVAVSEQNLAVAKATVEVNQRLEDDTIIRAPFDGVVTVRTAQPGEIVSPQFSGGGGIAKIVDMDSLEVDVDVSENFINRVRPHQPATVTLNAYPDWKIPARVIAVIPTADRAKATVKVRIGFETKDARIVPEIGARVSFLPGD